MRIILIVTAIVIASSPLFPRTPDPEVSLKITKIEKQKNGKVKLEYSAEYIGPDPAVFENSRIYLPEETTIIEGIADSSEIHENDFLYGRIRLDLNNNSKYDDIYPISVKNRNIYINGKEIYPLLTETGKRTLFTPLKPDGTENINRITDSGPAFTLYYYDRKTGKIKAGIGSDKNEISFLSLPNSQVMIEIIPDIENDSSSGNIDGIKTYYGRTNEIIPFFQGDYYRPRITGYQHLPVKKGTKYGSFTFNTVGAKTFVRITLFFSVTGKICIFDTKSVLIE